MTIAFSPQLKRLKSNAVTHCHVSADRLSECGKPCRIFLEPSAENTAPALTAAALEAVAGDKDAVLLVMPADLAVPDAHAFQGAVSRHAEPGCGYIRVGVPLGSDGGLIIDRFVEKQHRELAEQYVRSGEY